MALAGSAAIAATVVLSALIIFQLLLAAGLPLGRFAWGGQHGDVLPVGLRWTSLSAVPILGFAAWVAMARADLVAPGAGVAPIRVAAWVFVGYFALNVIMNLASRSAAERWTMTPVAAVLVLCFTISALSEPSSIETSAVTVACLGSK